MARPATSFAPDELGSFATVHRYDEAGCGLSDWDVADVSLDARVGTYATMRQAG